MKNSESLSPASKKVLALLLDGKVAEAERFIQMNFDQRLSTLRAEIEAVGHERSLLMNTLLLAKLKPGGQLPAVQTRPPQAIELAARVERRRKVMDCAAQLAKKHDGTVRVQQVVDALKAEKFDLGTEAPNTSVGVMLHRSPEWERVSAAVFRYRGAQLDLRK